MQSTIKTLKEYYAFLTEITSRKREIVKRLLTGKEARSEDITYLEESLEIIKQIPKDDKDRHALRIDDENSIRLRLDYNKKELDKDITYLKEGEEGLLKKFKEEHEGFEKEVEEATKKLKEKKYELIITDRDGTINNYCETYEANKQSIYNAMLLAKIASKTKIIIVSSAPLDGMRRALLLPEETIIVAGSKGRELLVNGKYKAKKTTREEEQTLTELDRHIEELLAEEANKKYALIGSGYQKKHGQRTIARQDINKTIQTETSKRWLARITKIVEDINKEEKKIDIEDTGLDIEIILTKKGATKAFDKADGVEYITKELDIKKGTPTLTCGDTNSDIALVQGVRRSIDEETTTLFSTTDKALKEKIRKNSKTTSIVSNPDALLQAIYNNTRDNQ